MKRLNSIFSCSNCVNIVPSKKALYQEDNQIFITPPERTNKELINLVPNDLKKLTFYFELQQSSKVRFSNNHTKDLSLCDNQSCPVLIYLGITIMFGQIRNVLTLSAMMWRTEVPIWAAALVPSVCLLTMVHNLISVW